MKIFNSVLFNSLVYFSCYFYPPSAFAENQYGYYGKSDFSKLNYSMLVNWNSVEGKKRLFQSKYNEDFFQLAHNFQPQANPLYCGIASSVMVLNALRIAKGNIPSQSTLEVQKPVVWGGDSIPYKLYSQSTFLNKKTDIIKLQDIIELKNITAQNQNDGSKFDPGLTLSQLKGVLEAYQVQVLLVYAQDNSTVSIEKFRNHLKKVLSESEKFIIINYKSNQIGQAGGGHISPIAAYDQVTDSVLVLDVSGHLNPWLWAPLKDLYLSMNTKDGDKFRGYLVVEDKKP
ncbi:MAG: hypothetical protein HON94_10800 [Methylococcales bacterium]|nr:hypothetical protein [Methylococcales bacterium]MBT7409764.1 hypothetical protein [Methylococcales bacterium]